MSRRMIRPSMLWFLWFALALALAGCSSDDDIPSECAQACDTACARAVTCGFLASNERGECTDTCIDVLEDTENLIAAGCRSAEQQFANASCAQLANDLGLRSATRASQDDKSTQAATGMLEVVLQAIIQSIMQSR
ncbi:MAG: hypothetical protein AB7N91_11115 [Candidatus Tectimicrobiota bacterium]